MEVKLTKTIVEVNGKKYVNFYLVMPNGKSVAIKQKWENQKSDFIRLSDNAELIK